MHLFPFEKIEKGESVAIYGAGVIGQEFVAQIRKSNYAKLAFVIDKNADKVHIGNCKIIYPEFIKDYDFDKIVIALQSEKNINDVKKLLINLGVDESRIIYTPDSNLADAVNQPFCVNGENDEILHIAIHNSFGLGDAMMDILLINGLRKTIGEKCTIDYICRYKELFLGNPMPDHVYSDEEILSEQRYDLYIESKHIAQIVYWAEDKVKRISETLHTFCKHNIELQEKYMGRPVKMHELYLRAKLLNRTRIEEIDLYNDLGISRNDMPVFTWDCDENEVLKRYGLFGIQYIAVNRDIDVDGSLNHPKLWSKKYYEDLLSLLKQKYQDIYLVQLGAGRENIQLDGIDINLVGRTTIDETKVLLKNAITLISSEGGLVHLMHFLNGKSIVIFGPTDEKHFGYEKDIKVVNRKCGLPCVYMEDDWGQRCILGKEQERCVNQVTPEMVMKVMETVINPSKQIL